MYNINDIFYLDNDYINKVKFCDENNLKIVALEADAIGRRYQLQAVSMPTEEEILNDLRMRREVECFLIVNRGQCWYNNLSESQKTELNGWYQAWLDVTETKTLPIKPIWLN